MFLQAFILLFLKLFFFSFEYSIYSLLIVVNCLIYYKKNIPPEFGGIFDYLRSVHLFSVVYICHNGFGLLSFALLSHSHSQPHLPDGSNNG